MEATGTTGHVDRNDRVNGYAPIGDYAVLGDGRTAALVARDGAIDWLCWPNLDSPSVFGRLLDAERGGAFELLPDVEYEVERRYSPRTNVLETTFHTARGSVRLTDALTLPFGPLPPMRELVRRVEGVSGSVPMRYRLMPRFGYGLATTRIRFRGTIPVADCGGDAAALCSWDAGAPSIDSEAIAGGFETRPGKRSTLCLVATRGEPLVFPDRGAVETRLDATRAHWEEWSRSTFHYDGPWADAVLRSALALKMLVFAPSGAVAAAATTSLPEAIGGTRNWDYRYCWIRDSAFALSSLLHVGCVREAEAFAWWFMHATAMSTPKIGVLYRLDGGNDVREHELALDGYRGSRPVRHGNAAVDQLQLDIYGSLLETAWVYASGDRKFDPDTARRYQAVANYLCKTWDQPDAGIWEVRSEPKHFTHSKLMCWVGLDRAFRLARDGHLDSADCETWRRTAEDICRFIDEECWSDEQKSYTRSAGSEELDASLLLIPDLEFPSCDEDRQRSTVAAIERKLADGALVRRYRGDDGLPEGEGYFLPCSFWLVQALAETGSRRRAEALMEELVGLANDVGLYAEEMNGERDMLGNFPQALTHMALIHAAIALAQEDER